MAREEGDDLVLRIQFGRMLGHAVACQVGGRGHGDPVRGADAPRHQGLVAELAPADHAVHVVADQVHQAVAHELDRKSTRLNSSHSQISYAVFCLKKKTKKRFFASAFKTRKTHAPKTP